MSQSIFIFDFGANEEAAQQARHKIDAWRQGFRLGNKMLLKFDRKESSGEGAGEAEKKSAGKQEKAEKAKGPGNIRLLVRLDFSDHERLSHQRWLDRIPGEEPFKSASSQTFRTGDPEFSKTAELFDSLD